MAFLAGTSITYVATRGPWRGETELLPWPLAVVLATVGVASSVLFGWLTLGTLVADGFRMTCPRCGGDVTWLNSHWAPFVGARRTSACFRCNAILRTERTDGEWQEVERDA